MAGTTLCIRMNSSASLNRFSMSSMRSSTPPSSMPPLEGGHIQSLQSIEPRSSPDIAIPMPSGPPLELPGIQQQQQQTTASDCYLSEEHSLTATLGNWSRSPTFFSPSSEDPSASSKGLSRRQSIVQRLFERSWIQPTIGVTTLLVTLIALFVYSHRTFVMAKWTEKNDMLQACAQLIQVDIRSQSRGPPERG